MVLRLRRAQTLLSSPFGLWLVSQGLMQTHHSLALLPGLPRLQKVALILGPTFPLLGSRTPRCPSIKVLQSFLDTVRVCLCACVAIPPVRSLICSQPNLCAHSSGREHHCAHLRDCALMLSHSRSPGQECSQAAALPSYSPAELMEIDVHCSHSGTDHPRQPPHLGRHRWVYVEH